MTSPYCSPLARSASGVPSHVGRREHGAAVHFPPHASSEVEVGTEVGDGLALQFYPAVPARVSFDPVVDTTIRLRGAADLPQRLVVEKVRPLWKLILGDKACFTSLYALRTALLRAGPAGDCVWAQLPTALSRFPITKASLRATTTLYIFDPTPGVVRSGFRALRYSGADEAKDEVSWLAEYYKLTADQTAPILAAVDVWYPVYKWADEEIETNGWE